MEYEGKLYGKVGNGYFPLENNSKDFDDLKAKSELFDEMLESIEECLIHFESYKQIVGDKNSAPEWLVKKVKKLIKKATL